jgi:hypothetical protein
MTGPVKAVNVKQVRLHLFVHYRRNTTESLQFTIKNKCNLPTHNGMDSIRFIGQIGAKNEAFFFIQLNGLDAGWSGNTTQHKLDRNDYAPVETTQVKVEAPSFYDNRHMKVDVRPTHRPLLTPGNIPVTHFC